MSDKAAKRLRDWNDGAEDVPATYTHDAWEFQRDLRDLLAERDAAQAERDTARRNEQIARGWEHQAQAQAAEEICARNEAENKLEAAQAEVARLREALEEIERGHIPSMPMTEVVDELTWAQMWVGNLRKIARLALATKAPDDPR